MSLEKTKLVSQPYGSSSLFKFYGLAVLAWGVIVIRTSDPVIALPSI